MNIWILNHYAGSIEFGMEFRHYYFAKELITMGHNVTIIAGSYSHLRKKNPKISKSEEEWHEGIRFIWVPTCVYSGNGLGRIKSMIDYYLQSVFVAKKLKSPDVILSSSPHPLACLAGIKIAKKKKCKCISEVRDLWPEAFVYYKGLSKNSAIVKIIERYEHKIYKKSDTLIFTKPGDIDYLREKKWLKSTGGDVDDVKCFYINNGVDLNNFKKQIETCIFDGIKENGSDVFAVTYVGTIREVNNVDMLLDAAGLLKKYNNIKFRIFGDGEELKRLIRRKTDENLENVTFYGRVEKQFVPYILSKSSVNILNYSPTMYNWARGNSSNKLFEYMACGRPVISTVEMGYSPIKKYGCGLEIDDCNGDKLAKAIEQLRNADESVFQNMGKNAALAANDFDYPKLTQKLILVLKKTIGGKEND